MPARHRQAPPAGEDPRADQVALIHSLGQVDHAAAGRGHVAHRRDAVAKAVARTLGGAQRNFRIGLVHCLGQHRCPVRHAAIGEMHMGVDQPGQQGRRAMHLRALRFAQIGLPAHRRDPIALDQDGAAFDDTLPVEDAIGHNEMPHAASSCTRSHARTWASVSPPAFWSARWTKAGVSAAGSFQIARASGP